MAELRVFEPGGYAFLAAGFPYSSGVIALPGHRIVRVRLPAGGSMGEGFAAIRAHLTARGRPLTALCAAELRSPEPFTAEGFQRFNMGYVDVLRDWSIVRDGVNPVARSNVAPVHDAPRESGFYAFCYTVPADHAGVEVARAVASPVAPARDFVVAGAAERVAGKAPPEDVVARDDTSAAGMVAKAGAVVATMRRRCTELGGDWARLTAVQIYTAYDLYPAIAAQLAPAGLAAIGLTWHPCRPPVAGLDFEMDVRSVSVELAGAD